MIHYIFDLDDTLIIHKNNMVNYHMIKEDNQLTQLLEKCWGPCYIYTNGTGSHALTILGKMNIKDKFDKIYSRDTIPYMKPDERSVNDIHNDISYRDPEVKFIFFFDDHLENLKMASKLGWVTIWIHPNYLIYKQYIYVNLAFPNIKDALKSMDKI